MVMSEQHSLNIPAHHNIYTGNSNRDLRIDFSIPQNGVNKHTGLIVFVPGFGGNIDSKVYKKMREIFADRYNMVTIQCEYFGSAYMQSTNNYNIKNYPGLEMALSKVELKRIAESSSNFLDILSKKNIVLPVIAKIDENVEEFNDMGYMQAIDIVSAVEAVKIILHENKLTFNANRVIGYGHSHGAYLLYLSNRLAPNIFSYLVDNSAWIEPAYLSSNRFLYQKLGDATLAIEFDYLAKRVIKNKRDLNLKTICKNLRVDTQVLSFQGDNDNLVNHEEKKRIIESVNNSNFVLVKKEDVDNIKYNSNKHGLDADFLELFSFALEWERPVTELPQRDLRYVVDLGSASIKADSTQGLPIFNFTFK